MTKIACLLSLDVCYLGAFALLRDRGAYSTFGHLRTSQRSSIYFSVAESSAMFALGR